MIIGLSGYARSGKDTVAQVLVTHYGFTRIAFADPMREALLRLNPSVSLGSLYVPLSNAMLYHGHDWEKVKEQIPEVRGLLQRMGTEVGRQMFGENIWVDYALSEAEKHENVVFSDVRFQNEADAILRNGGRLWRIERPGVGPVNEHVSDSAMDNYPREYFDLTIVNDSSKDDLYVELAKTMSMMRAHNGN